jgi:hypothetical protein
MPNWEGRGTSVRARFGIWEGYMRALLRAPSIVSFLFAQEGEGSVLKTGWRNLLLLEVEQRAQYSSDALPPL